MEIIYSTTPAETTGEQLSNLLQQHADTPTLLLLSGGSALALLDHVSEAALGPQVTFTTLDERFSTDEAVNNFAQIKATTFYERAITRGAATIDTSVSAADTLAEASARFATALHEWRTTHPHGVVITTMGVGSDGHTAGIFPEQAHSNYQTTDWVLAETLPESVNEHRERITVTPTFLLHEVTHALGYITGEAKQTVFDKLTKPDCDTATMPACILRDIRSVTIITDRTSSISRQ